MNRLFWFKEQAEENVNEKQKQENKKKRKGKGCLIAFLVVILLLVISGGVGWLFVSSEHREARNLPLNAVDFSRLTDGTYHGVYLGGKFQWRYNECDVTVTDGMVSGIRITASVDPNADNPDTNMLYARVIENQSLQVDTITMSTLTSKGYLQCVENALLLAME